MSGSDELNNTAELLDPSTSANTSYSFGPVKIEQIGPENRVVTPLELTIIDCRSAVVEKIDLHLRLSTKVTVGRITDHPMCQVTVFVEGENKVFSAEIENIRP